MNKSGLVRKGLLTIIGLAFSATLWAHGGAAGTDTDQCKFELEPSHWIHYTAYQPKAFPAEDFCGSIPSTGTLTQLVFDYQDVRYRNMSIEFEVTKEPEGKRVFFQEAAKHKSGTVVLSLENGVPEPGKYLIHITLVPDQGERLDAHMSFTAGGGKAASKGSYGLYAFFLLAGLYVFYLSNAGFKKKIDDLITKLKNA
ncbi:hypothetical protein GO003_005325 [Methylicorpusculum oleiharenae]|uniref:hypothetical protein n=1 Tax=Methylicorpusculum oleiharenae TaxID=1338687 RepID=UPI00135A2E9F|nr:hypothetical protein [Methylicorpusculum oleiharenae]MCD2449808.1 hypothetical protein [Methylicorpusculum oleiharenae]